MELFVLNTHVYFNKQNEDNANTSVGEFNFPRLYTDRQKIPREKFNHLQELKLSIPKDFHLFNDSLPFE